MMNLNGKSVSQLEEDLLEKIAETLSYRGRLVALAAIEEQNSGSESTDAREMLERFDFLLAIETETGNKRRERKKALKGRGTIKEDDLRDLIAYKQAGSDERYKSLADQLVDQGETTDAELRALVQVEEEYKAAHDELEELRKYAMSKTTALAGFWEGYHIKEYADNVRKNHERELTAALKQRKIPSSGRSRDYKTIRNIPTEKTVDVPRIRIVFECLSEAKGYDGQILPCLLDFFEYCHDNGRLLAMFDYKLEDWKKNIEKLMQFIKIHLEAEYRDLSRIQAFAKKKNESHQTVDQIPSAPNITPELEAKLPGEASSFSYNRKFKPPQLEEQEKSIDELERSLGRMVDPEHRNIFESQVTSPRAFKKKPATCNLALQEHLFDFTDLIESNTRWFVGRKKILTEVSPFFRARNISVH